MDKKDSMSPPIFNDKTETLNEFLRRVDKYKIHYNKEKYNLVLNIINKIFNLNEEYTYKSLTSIKHVKLKSLNVDQKFTESIIIQNKDKLKELFNFETDNIEYNLEGMVVVISRLLQLINYKLKIYTMKNIKYCTISVNDD